MSSSPDTEPVMSCAECGASVYQEHVERGLAAYWGGQLLCPHCVAEKKKSGPAGDDMASMSLVDESEVTDRSEQSAIHGRSGFSIADTRAPDTYEYKRPLNQTGQGATRIRVFHSKMSDGAIRHLEQSVNEWLDHNPEIEIKFSTTTVGTWEGKHAEPNLILTIFY